MSTALREAAMRQLRAAHGSDGGTIRRLSIEIDVDGRLETVMVGLRGEELQCVASDGSSEGPHVAAALRFLARLDSGDEPLEPVASLAPSKTAEPSTAHDLADALDDLLTAITRVGVRGARFAPSVDATLERVLDSAPQPVPSGLGRFMGRLHHELRSEDVRRVARILDGVSRLVEALREGASAPESKERIHAWLGTGDMATPEVELLYDRTMIEVGREWLSGKERASVERRYLVDTQTGVVYREDRPRNAVASLGPCPRQLRVGLAEVERGPAPPRIRVLQYEVQPHVPLEAWEQVEQVASRSFAEVTERYRDAIRAEPALCEPFVLVKPYRIEHNGVFKAFDAEGHRLVLERNERRGAVLAVYDLLAEGVRPTWLAGRLTDRAATLCVVPFSVGSRDRGYIRL